MANSKYGARVYYQDDGVIIIRQTVLRPSKNGLGQYVLDADENSLPRERHIAPGDDAALIAAIKAAAQGQL